MYKSDIEIAQGTNLQTIDRIARVAGIEEKYIQNYGSYKAKVDWRLLDDETLPVKKGKLVLITSAEIGRASCRERV